MRALYHANEPMTISDSFKVTGLYPLDPTEVLKNPYVGDLPSDFEEITKKKRSGVSISGCVLTAPELWDQLRDDKRKKEEKKKAVGTKRKREEKQEVEEE